MHTRSTLIPLLTLTLAGAVCAQTKFSGELKCGKPGPMHTLAVGDRPDHTFRIGKQECTWTKPFVVEGLTSVSEEVTYFMDLTGDKASARSLNVGTMSNGDKYYVSTQSSGIVKNDVIQRSEVTWTWTGGTGKLKGLTAKGTSKGKGAADGTIWVAQGEYRVAK